MMALLWLGVVFVGIVTAFATLTIMAAFLIPAVLIFFIKKAFAWMHTRKQQFFTQFL